MLRIKIFGRVLAGFLLFGGAQAQPAAHTVVFDGEGEGTGYKIAASERLEQVSGRLDGHRVTVNANDTLRGTSARGFVGSGKDGYRVWGEIITLELENEDGATIYVDSEVYSPRDDSILTFDLDTSQSRDMSQLETPDEADDQPDLDRSKGGRLHPDQFDDSEEALIDCLVRRRRGENTEECNGNGYEGDASGEGDKELTYVSPTIEGYVKPPSSEDGQSGGGKNDKGRENMETTPTVGFAGGEPTRSDVSGRAGDSTHSFEFRMRGLSQIGWKERFDKPCRLNLLSRADGKQIWARIIDRCGQNDTSVCENEICKTDYLAVDQTHEASVIGHRPSITAIRVCTNDRKNGRVKGVEVRGGEILDNGSVSTVIKIESDTLPHCRKWEPLVLCPSGAAATGVRAHFDRGKGTSRNVEQLVGLQLVCRQIIRQ